MRMLFLMLASGVVMTGLTSFAAEPESTNPQIANYGAVVLVPSAAEQPRRGMKIVFDIVAEAKPEEVNKGLESVARYLNLNAQAGHSAGDVQLALVLHGPATKVALDDNAYAKHAKAERNPNLPLIDELKRQGVEVFVCGQSLARNKYAVADGAEDVTVAVSAMTVNANKQQDGYSYISVH